jgi:hypothetical protein
VLCAEGGNTAAAYAAAAAQAFAAGGSEAQAFANAFSAAIGQYGCSAIQPLLSRVPPPLSLLRIALGDVQDCCCQYYGVRSEVSHQLISNVCGDVPPMCFAVSQRVTGFQTEFHCLLQRRKHRQQRWLEEPLDLLPQQHSLKPFPNAVRYSRKQARSCKYVLPLDREQMQLVASLGQDWPRLAILGYTHTY